MIRLIYASRAAPNFGPADVHHILRTSRRNNPLLGLTGVLVMADGYFLQALEGARSRVNNLYARILLDRRHTDSAILSYRDIDRRDFGDWSMGYVLNSEKNREMFLAYSHDAAFSPLDLGTSAAQAMLSELAEHARRLGGTAPALAEG
ncbi:MAG: hypothetical protein Fur0019_13530 [Tibeticola sp.]